MNILITGKVIQGDRYGRKIGYPTANLDRRFFVRNKLSLKFGVYAGTVKRENNKKVHTAAIVIGPKDHIGLPKIEAHLLDFTGNLYGEKLALTLTAFIRPYRNFPREKELTAQIARDIRKVRAVASLCK